MKFPELEQIMEEKGIHSLSDIARLLNTSPQAVSNWKARDEIPARIVIELQQRFINLDEPLSYKDNSIYSDYQSNTMPLSDILVFLSKKLKIIIILPIISSILAIIYVLFFTEPVYISTAKIIPIYGAGSGSPISSILSNYGLAFPSGGGQKADLTTPALYPEIIKSRTLANNLLERKFNTKRFGENKTLLHILTGQNTDPNISLIELKESAMKSCLGMIELEFLGNAKIYILKGIAFEPGFATQFTWAVIEELKEFHRTIKNKQIVEKRLFIVDRLQNIEKDLIDSEERLKEFRIKNRQIENSPVLLLENERLSRDINVKTEVFTSLKQQFELVKIEEVEESSTTHILEEPSIPLSKSNSSRRVTVVIAGTLGIFLAIIVILLTEFIKKQKSKRYYILARKNIKRNLYTLVPFRKKLKKFR